MKGLKEHYDKEVEVYWWTEIGDVFVNPDYVIRCEFVYGKKMSQDELDALRNPEEEME